MIMLNNNKTTNLQHYNTRNTNAITSTVKIHSESSTLVLSVNYSLAHSAIVRVTNDNTHNNKIQTIPFLEKPKTTIYVYVACPNHVNS